jgi:FkbM family methyltransferase
MNRRILIVLVGILLGIGVVAGWLAACYLKVLREQVSALKARPQDPATRPPAPASPVAPAPACLAQEGKELDRRKAVLAARFLAESVLIETDLTAHQERWQTPGGAFWMPTGNNIANVTYILAEESEGSYGGRGNVESEIHPGDTVLDCGAHVGTETRRALAAGASKVVAIEIAPENLESLRRNFSDEIRVGKVVVYPKGVWNKDDTMTLNVSSDSAEDSLIMGKATPEGPRVALTTIDHIVTELALKHVDFIKMDIEGAERQALEGAQETIRRFRPRLGLAGYHLPDDVVALPFWVQHAAPGYWFSFHGCRIWNGPRPESILFRPEKVTHERVAPRKRRGRTDAVTAPAR